VISSGSVCAVAFLLVLLWKLRTACDFCARRRWLWQLGGYSATGYDYGFRCSDAASCVIAAQLRGGQ
jgi:hypothetical protein